MLDVFGVTVRNPKGWLIVYKFLSGPPPFKNFIALIVLRTMVFVIEALPIESRTVIIEPGRFKLDNKTTYGPSLADVSTCTRVVLAFTIIGVAILMLHRN
jgi:hypothetical protein